MILVYLYYEIPFGEVFGALTSVKGSHVVGACALALMLHLLNARRLKILTDQQGFRLSAWQVAQIHFGSLFYKMLLPGGMMTAVGARFYKLTQEKRSAAAALSSVVVDGIAAVFGLSVVGLVCWLVDRPMATGLLGWFLVAVLCVIVGLSAILLLGRGLPITRLVVDRIPLPVVSRKLRTWLESLAEFQRLSPVSMLGVLLLSIVPHLFGVLIYAVLAAALGIPIDVVAWGWIRSAVILVTMIPISVAGLGVRDGALLYLLQSYGVAGEQALAFAFLIFGSSALFVALLGGLVEGRAALTRSFR